MNEYVLKLLFIRNTKIQIGKNCQYKVIRITKMKYIDNTKCWHNCGALEALRHCVQPHQEMLLTISNHVSHLFDQAVSLQVVFPTQLVYIYIKNVRASEHCKSTTLQFRKCYV